MSTLVSALTSNGKFQHLSVFCQYSFSVLLKSPRCPKLYRYHSVTFICASPVTCDVRTLFLCLVAISISSLEKYLFSALFHFFYRVAFILPLNYKEFCKLSEYETPTWIFKYSLPFCGLYFHSLDNIL